MLLFYIVPALFGALLVVIKYSLWREKYCQNLPGIKPGFFNIPGDLTKLFMQCVVFNNGLPILQYFTQFLKERNEQFQQQHLFYIWAFYTPHVCFVKAEAVKQLLSKSNGENEKSWHYDIIKPLVGEGLGTSTMEKWKPKRKLLAPCFHIDILRGFMPVFNECSRDLVELLEKETTKEFTCIDSIVTLTALDAMFGTIFGTEIAALENNRSKYLLALKRLLDIYMSRHLKFWEWPDFIFRLTSGREAQEHQSLLGGFMKSFLQNKKKEYRTGNKDNGKRKRKALIDLLLELHLKTEELSEEDLCGEVNTFVAAGHETASHTITWALFLIGLHPDVQEKIHEELDRVFGSDMDRDVTESDLNELKYLDCVLKETQRLYPAIPLIGRDLKVDSTISGHTIPKDSTCLVLIYFLHRDKDVFPDPEKFDPDRFLPENSVKLPEYGYIPFSAGPRNCIGQKFAIMEMKTILSFVLMNYTIKSLDTREQVVPLMQLTLYPSIPVRIIFKHRKNINCGETLCLS